MDKKRSKEILEEIKKVNRELDELAREAKDKREGCAPKNGAASKKTPPWTGPLLLD